MPQALKPLLLRASAAVALALLASLPARALELVPTQGAGNLALFDPATGSGGWAGSLVQFVDPAAPVANPYEFVSVVLFSADVAAQSLSGTFEFTTADLSGRLAGVLSGSWTVADLFGQGGQISLNYDIQSASGSLAGYAGYGLSFLNYDPMATGLNNYAEEGLLALAVPEPATWALFAGGLLALAALGRARRGVQAPALKAAQARLP